ncbi:MAG: hypothetical protein KDA60_02175 [Planctomycetales bacterium]|nr:hypothetical protein [Planctomycetales bacterium]
MTDMIMIDGAEGEGGGQVVRSSLALAIVTQSPVTITNVRAKRKRPGLLRQHLTALRAAADICGAQVTGNELGSSHVTFQPGPVHGGEYHFRIGTAGSTTLVMQTILLPLLCAEHCSQVTLEGGTQDPLAPPYRLRGNGGGRRGSGDRPSLDVAEPVPGSCERLSNRVWVVSATRS